MVSVSEERYNKSGNWLYFLEDLYDSNRQKRAEEVFLFRRITRKPVSAHNT